MFKSPRPGSVTCDIPADAGWPGSRVGRIVKILPRDFVEKIFEPKPGSDHGNPGSRFFHVFDFFYLVKPLERNDPSAHRHSPAGKPCSVTGNGDRNFTRIRLTHKF